MKKVVIVGGGVGGTIVANALAEATNATDVSITVISETARHVYQPGFISATLSSQKPDSLMRDERRLLSGRVQFVHARANRIDAQNRLVEVEGKQYPYDFLVLAVGARYNPEEIPGFSEGAHHFYDIRNALRLRETLAHFSGGRVVIGVGSVPYKCPPAPLEFALLLDEYFTKKGIRNEVEIEYVYPINGVFTIKAVEPALAKLLEERNIPYRTFFNTESIDPEKRVVHSMEGESVSYDLLVMTPPHRGARLIEDSGLGDRGGWIPTDRYGLNVKGHDDIYALGDATDIPVSKSGSAAHFQAKVLSENLAEELSGDGAPAKYDGHVMCFLETGYGKGLTLDFSYNRPPKASRPNRIAHWEKILLNKLYWSTVPKARV